jgi:MFS family permease
MILGVLGHTARFGVWAFLPDPYYAVAVNLLHGICYAFFFATLYILIDEVFPKDARTSAQGLFNFLILGLGPIVGRYLWPAIQNMYTVDKVVDYKTVLLFPAGAGLVAAILLLFFFHPPKGKLDTISGVE